eukprot:scaffold867_cov317-Pavlova_lutheri.AAC.59
MRWTRAHVSRCQRRCRSGQDGPVPFPLVGEMGRPIGQEPEGSPVANPKERNGIGRETQHGAGNGSVRGDAPFLHGKEFGFDRKARTVGFRFGLSSRTPVLSIGRVPSDGSGTEPRIEHTSTVDEGHAMDHAALRSTFAWNSVQERLEKKRREDPEPSGRGPSNRRRTWSAPTIHRRVVLCSHHSLAGTALSAGTSLQPWISSPWTERRKTHRSRETHAHGPAGRAHQGRGLHAPGLGRSEAGLSTWRSAGGSSGSRCRRKRHRTRAQSGGVGKRSDRPCRNPVP